MIKKFKKEIAIILIISMVFANAGISTFATSVETIIEKETRKESVGVKDYASPSNSVGAVSSVSQSDEEPEEDTETDSANIEEPEEDKEDAGASDDVGAVSLASPEDTAETVSTASSFDVEMNDATPLATDSEIFDLATESEIEIASASKAMKVADQELFRTGSPEYIWFGTYPQSSTDYDVVEPIRWIVLNDENDKKYLLSEKILANRQIGSGNSFAEVPLKD